MRFCLHKMQKTVGRFQKVGHWQIRSALNALRERYDAVEELMADDRHAAFSQAARGVGDLERILARVSLRSARPRDLAQLRQTLGGKPAYLVPAKGRIEVRGAGGQPVTANARDGVGEM